MVDKKSPAEGWPVINGDYVAGDPESPVAAATLASHIEQIPVDAGAAIAGPCKTENLGIEKMISNLISNPNLRFLILCCLLYTSPSPRDRTRSRMPSSA